MSEVEQHLRMLVRISDPDGTVTVRWLADLVGMSVERQKSQDEPLVDLTVTDVAARLNRAPSTVRGWLSRGELSGYKLNGRDWRVPHSALRRYQSQQAAEEVEGDHGDGVDIGEWRNLR